ncbi:MAG: TolC family protein [Robiginitalea sp.]|uniref:TolC family protein n=1 Tax=Robiginitalea sp. TaxID=1902411 RepID=UPI003C76A633
MKLRIITAFCLLSLGMLSGQVKKWTLEECVIYAVENNLSVQQAELDLRNAELDKSEAISGLLPNVNAQLQAGGNTGLTFDPTTNQPTNTTIQTATGNTTASVNLFDGLRNYNALRRADMNKLANQYRLDDLKDDIRLNVALAYLQILSNKETLKVSRALFKATEQDLERTKAQVEEGVLPKGDLLEIQATAASQEQQIVNGENEVLLSRISLAQLLQITDYVNFDVADEDYNVPPSDVLLNSPREIYEKALTFRNDIKASEAFVDLAEKDVKIAKGAYMPTLSAFFQYSTRYSSQFRDPLTGSDVSFGDQLWLNDGIFYGARINVPIFNGLNVRNSVKRSQIDLERAELQFEQDKLALETDVNRAYVDVKNSAKNYEAAVKTFDARRLSYEYAKERYEVGLLNAFDFGVAQARVDNAAAEVIRTKYDYIFRIKLVEFYFGLPLTLN